MLTAFYAFGWYTPVFRGMYELLPGVKLFRRPADATFVFGALIAVMVGYCVHRWLAGERGSRIRRLAEKLIAVAIVIVTSGSPRRPSARASRSRRS